MNDNRVAAARFGKSAISRRRVLNGGTALGAYFLLPRSAGAQHQGHDHSAMGLDPGPIVQAAAASVDQPLLEPEVRRSVNGVLNTTLSCRYTYKDIGGLKLYLRSYEGTSHGPTLRMKPGETLKIRLSNDFPPNRDALPQNMALPHQFNNTNSLLSGNFAEGVGYRTDKEGENGF